MVTAKKLPSGSWRCSAFVSSETITLEDGTKKTKQIRKSFTVKDTSPKGKKLCEKMAADWIYAKEHELAQRSVMTIEQAIDKYIEECAGVLSVSTVRSYRSIKRNNIEMIKNKRVDALSNGDVQKWVSSLAKEHKPKTVKNCYSLITRIVREFDNGRAVHARIPQQETPDLYLPTNEDIKKLFDYFKKNDPEMFIAIKICAFGGLRRSEVCALTADDISRDTIKVNKAVVRNSDNEWITKTTKNVSSTRSVKMPAWALEGLPTEGKILSLTPAAITNRFRRAITALGLQHFRLHDLRHYAVSLEHALGIPDEYIMDRQGFSTDWTMKRRYRDKMGEYVTQYDEKLFNHLSEFFN